MGAGYFNDLSFINYLKYLKYWSTPEYIKYVKYPISLYFLDLLTSDDNYYKRFQDKRFFDQVIWDLKNFTMKSVNYYLIRAKEDYENNLKQEQQEQQQFQMQQPQPPQWFIKEEEEEENFHEAQTFHLQ